MSDETRVREVSRMKRGALLDLVYEDARKRGREWAIGGPGFWSKDELVRYVLHEVGEPMPPLGVSER